MSVSDSPSTAIFVGSRGPQNAVPARLFFRIVCLAALFVVELIVVSIRLDTQALDGRGGLIGAIGDFGPHILQSIIAFTTVFLAFGYSKAKEALPAISGRLADIPIGWGFLGAHIGAMSAFAYLSVLLFGGTKSAFGDMAAVAWIGAGVLGIAAALFFFIPPPALREILRNTGSAWVYAAAAACATPVFVIASERLWKTATALTFELVKVFLWPFVSVVSGNPVTKTVGTQKFRVQIAPSCSGLEGMGLILVFGVLWLYSFRRDFRFPRALLLIPAGMVLMFLLNSIRIAALILIGNAGARSVALGGFHSQAGWIAFNGLALGLACVAHRVPWITARRPVVIGEETAPNPTAAYLVPFLAILGAAMISGASSGRFEWMYPLRFFAAAGALLVFRSAYSNINWKFGWAAPAIGGLVFLIWISLDRLAGIPGQNGIAAGLEAWPTPARIAWLVFRTLAAVVTVPIAEELAFRGFLLRRLISADFDSVSPRRWTLWAVFGSSIAFGLLHGHRWMAGTMAGILYAGAQKWRGRIGDAVAAHGVTNALIAAWVLWGGHWSLW